jgi:hypothetical protein
MITCVVVIDGLTLLSYFTQVSLFKLVLLCLYLKSFQRTLSFNALRFWVESDCKIKSRFSYRQIFREKFSKFFFATYLKAQEPIKKRHKKRSSRRLAFKLLR